MITEAGENQYIFRSDEGKTLSGPFMSSSVATSEREKLQPGSEVEFAEVSIVESKTKGMEGFWICLDGFPAARYLTRESASLISRAFDLGSVALINKRISAGLGDMLALSGLAVVQANVEGGLVLPVKTQYEHEFKNIFINHPEIRCKQENVINGTSAENIIVYQQRISLGDTRFDQFERIYRHFHVPYRHRWDSCPIAKACENIKQLPVPYGEYGFQHDDPARNLSIDLEKLPSIPILGVGTSFHSNTVLAYKDVIENATEVHVIDSVFFHLTESLEPKGRLFLHRYAKPYHRRYCDFKTKHYWEIVL